MKIKFDAPGWEFKDGQFWLCLRIPTESRPMARNFSQTARTAFYDADIKLHRERRSLDANAYFWALCGKLAEVTRIPKNDIYKEYIKEIGGNFEILPVRLDAVERFIEAWGNAGLGYVCDRTGSSKLCGYENIICYYGSSTYDTAQMSRLIDLVVYDCQSQNIEVLPPQKLAAMMEDWTNAQTNKSAGNQQGG